MKQWKRFGIEKQEYLTGHYEVILSDYMTRKERAIKTIRLINVRNFNRGLKAFNDCVDSFLKPLDFLHHTMNSGRPKSTMEFWGRPSELDYTDTRPNIKDVVWGGKRTNLF